MSEPTRHQIIRDESGHALFILVPVRDYERMVGKDAIDEPLIPHAVVKSMVKDRKSLIRAWREYLGFTLEDVSTKMGISKATLSEMEQPGKSPRRTTLERIAQAMDLQWEQLRG